MMVLPLGSKYLGVSQKGAPAYLHALFGKDFPSDYTMRKLTKCTAALFRGGWELALVYGMTATSSQRAKYRNNE